MALQNQFGLGSQIYPTNSMLNLQTNNTLVNEQWSEKYAEMSIQETGHAKNLYDMFKEYISIQKKAYDGVLPSYIQKNWDCVSGCYEKCMSDIKELQSIMLGGE